MPRILDRYVSGTFIRLFLVVVVGAPLLFVIFDITDNLEDHLDAGLSWRRIGLSYLYRMPEFILWAFPIAALIATIFTVNNMTRHSEVAAAKSGGVSFFRLFLPVPLLGVVLTGAALALSELVPVTIRLRAEVMGERSRVRGTRANFVFQTEGGEVLVVPRLDAEQGMIFTPRMERQGDGERHPTVHAVAETGTYLPEQKVWALDDGYVRYLYADGTERTMGFNRLLTTVLDQEPEELLAQPKEPEEMGYAELKRFIGVLERAGTEPRKLRVELAQKIAIPVATLIIVLFAAPLANTSPRGGAAYGVGISLGITILYLMLFRVTGAMGAAGTVGPLVAAWSPNALFLLGAVVLTTRVRT